MRHQWKKVLLSTILMMGITIMVYPLVAHTWNSFQQGEEVDLYYEKVETLPDEMSELLLQKAEQYNQDLYLSGQNRIDEGEYNRQMSFSDEGLMGVIEIPSITVKLPIYHGTQERILIKGVGHIEYTSLPAGGINTHCVLSGHTGLPSGRLFTDLNDMNPGDVFFLYTCGQKLVYEVESVKTVLPDAVDEFRIEEGRDLCTLVTCTPYGINTHRLLVKGHRIMEEIRQEETEETVQSGIGIYVLAGTVLVCMIRIMKSLSHGKDG